MTGQGGGGEKAPCPSCGKPASGNFCQHCGAALGGRFCTECGAKLSGAARFCNQCGAPQRGAGGGGAGAAGGHRAAAAAALGGGNAPWWIAGIAMFGLILVVGWSMVKPDGPAAPAGGASPAGGDPAAGQSSLDLSTLTPREAADRLFDRVMRTLSSGDTAGGMAFQPMAVQAYQVAEPLDLDGVFHMALLEQLADPAAAVASAQRILAEEPDHLLGLGIAGEASAAGGDPAGAAEYYQHLLRVYDAQVARDLVEYEAHRGLLPEMKAKAEAFLAGG